MRQKGVVAAYSRKRNFVLIRPEGEERRLYCHRSEIADKDDISPGTMVEFTISNGRLNEARRVRAVA